MPQQRYRQLLIENSNHNEHWESTIADEVELADLDKDEIVATIKDSVEKGRMKPQLPTQEPKEALRKLKLLINGQLTRAAVLLLCRDTVSAYPQFLIRMAKFNGTNKSKPLNSRMVEGNAFVLIREAEEFLQLIS